MEFNEILPLTKILHRVHMRSNISQITLLFELYRLVLFRSPDSRANFLTDTFPMVSHGNMAA